MEDKSLEMLLVAQVVTLAHQIKEAKARRGTTTTDTCVGDAIRMIQNQRAEVLRKLAETR
uniref:hypothetical protein n=1 Tax=Burkholderia diffusa TaxID=488732 RepID=UPI001CC7FA67|nr:hypothetical protein [Burkholderia diffusa]